MSRGLGKMERAIMEQLCTRQPDETALQSSFYTERRNRFSKRMRFRLPPGVHDLRRVRRELNAQPLPTWAASFSRAVRRLIERNDLEIARDNDGLSDIAILHACGQRRFARLAPKR